MSHISIDSRCRGALYGLYIADALAMPVHWYYDRDALNRDYGIVKDYVAPKNPHPDSELDKHHYQPANPKGNILHDQSKYWGEKNIHYHQFLKAGENTLNVKLCNPLIQSLNEYQKYDPDDYLDRLISFMTTPGSHRDTYIDQYLRDFFSNYEKGLPPNKCGVPEKHLSGLNGVVPIVVFYRNYPEKARTFAHHHVALTHTGPLMEEATRLFLKLMLGALSGRDIKDLTIKLMKQNESFLLQHAFLDWMDMDDSNVVGNRLGTGCYIDESMPVVIYLLLKYHNAPKDGLIANTNLGGNNAARGAILGALLGAANGMDAFPSRWVEGLRHPPDDLLPLS